MDNLRLGVNDLSSLVDQITRNSIGLDTYFDSLINSHSTNYPPYNIIQLNNHESKLEIALAGFKKIEVKVYTEYGKLTVEGNKEDKKDNDYQHRGLSNRSFKRSWALSEDSMVKKVVFEDGLLTVQLNKIVPKHHSRKDYL